MGDIKIVKIIVATHKKYRMPADKMYLPLQVGAEEKKHTDKNELFGDYQKDNTGENISALNSGFCELTGLYWAWKNIKTDYIGLVHYRRYFGIKRNKDLWECILTHKDIEPFLGKVKIFVPKKRKYYIETLYSHYAHTHYKNQLDETRRIIAEKYPDYLKIYDNVMNQRSGYMFNMMIMSREWLDIYCTWLFDILFELKKRIDIPELSVFQSRFYGRISEIIFNVWLNYQITSGTVKENEVKELPYIHMEKINWKKKGIAFCKAKFLSQKYEESF